MCSNFGRFPCLETVFLCHFVDLHCLSALQTFQSYFERVLKLKTPFDFPPPSEKPTPCLFFWRLEFESSAATYEKDARFYKHFNRVLELKRRFTLAFPAAYEKTPESTDT